MNFYPVDTLVQVNGSFLIATSGVPIDPTAVTLFIMSPSNVITSVTYPGDIQRSGTGAYYYQFTPSGPGRWTYTWQGTGAVVASSFDTSFVVKASALIPG